MAKAAKKQPLPAPGPSFDWRRWAGVWFLLLHGVLWCAAHYPLFQGRMWVGGDTVHQFWPYHQFTRQQFLAHEIPWWNPHLFHGFPYFASLQSSLFYLPRWLFLPLPAHTALGASLLLHGALLGAGVSVYVWRRGRDFWAAAIAGWLVLCAGFFTGHLFAGHINFVEAGAWAGWVLVCWDCWLVDRRLKHLARLCGCLALSFLAGHPQITFMALFLFGFVAVADLLASRVWLKDALLGLLVVGVWFGALVMFQLAPALEVAHLTARTQGHMAETLSLPFSGLLSLVLPFGLGAAPIGAHVLGGNNWELYASLAATGWLALVLGLRRKSEGGEPPWRWLVLAGVCLLLALGSHTPVYGLLLKATPGLSFLRGPARFLLLVSVALVVAAGLAAGRVKAESLKRCLPVGLALLLAGGLAWGLSQGEAHGPVAVLLQGVVRKLARSGQNPQHLLGQLWKVFHLNGLWLAAVGGGLALAGGLARLGKPVALALFAGLLVESAALLLPFNNTAPKSLFAYPKPPNPEGVTVASLGGRPAMDDFLRMQMDTPEGFDPVILESYRRVLNRLTVRDLPPSTNGVNFSQWEDAAFDLLGVNWVFKPGKREGQGRWLPNEGAFPRAWTIQRLPAGEKLGRLTPTQMVRAHAPDGAGSVGGAWRGPNRFDLLVWCQHGPCTLASTYSLAPGWRVWVNGKPVNLGEHPRLLGHFFALNLPKGRHAVRAVYRPPGLATWGPVAAVAWGLALVAGLGIGLPQKKTKPP